MLGLNQLQESQPQCVEVFKRALQQQRFHHAYLIDGHTDRDVNEMGLAMAQRLICSGPVAGSGCGTCSRCIQIAAGYHPDLIQLKPDDKNKIGIDAVLEVNTLVHRHVQESDVKVVVVYNADLMTVAAQNALLKVLEEPPANTCFLLCTTRFLSLLITVRSRCQRQRLLPASFSFCSDKLSQAGVPQALLPTMAKLCGTDEALAMAWVEAGAEEIAKQVERAMSERVTAAELTDMAQDMASEKLTMTMALAFFELSVRNRLRAKQNGTLSHLPNGQPLGWWLQLDAAVDLLQQQRQQQAFNPNKVLVMETLLFTLCGKVSGGLL